ncbi:hypothetical protein MC77_011700 [Citrobacter koseri]|nr:hypothetical protein MC77_011700 [Citrobacter koseri]
MALALTGPTMCSSRRPDKAFTPPSGIMSGGAVLTGHAMCSSRRPDKAFTPPSGIMSGGAATRPAVYGFLSRKGEGLGEGGSHAVPHPSPLG